MKTKIPNVPKSWEFEELIKSYQRRKRERVLAAFQDLNCKKSIYHRRRKVADMFSIAPGSISTHIARCREYDYSNRNFTGWKAA